MVCKEQSAEFVDHCLLYLLIWLTNLKEWNERKYPIQFVIMVQRVQRYKEKQFKKLEKKFNKKIKFSIIFFL